MGCPYKAYVSLPLHPFWVVQALFNGLGCFCTLSRLMLSLPLQPFWVVQA